MRSYTLIELVMVIVLIGVLVGIGIPVMLETADAWSIASRFQNFAVQSAIVTTNRMSREMRRLRNDASVHVNSSSSQFRFTDVGNNEITYSRSGNTIMRNTDGLTDNATAMTFTYYDDNGNDITATFTKGYGTNTNIRRIRVDFSILAGTQTLNFRFQVRPQNLRRINERTN
jgi:prepilin-type N-terminal cleavage/methylation domain-containing protein